MISSPPDHAYLMESIVLLMIGFFFAAALPGHRRLLFLSAAMCAPYAILSPLFVPEYWDPAVTVRWLVRPEELIGQGSAGMTVAFFAIYHRRRRIVWGATLGAVMWRHLGCCVAGAVLIGLGRQVFPGVKGVMPSVLFTMLLLAVFLLILRPSAWVLSLAGAVAYTVFHFLDVLAGFAIWPGWAAAWNPEAQLAWQPLGVPGYEILWAAAFGFVWPLILAVTCDLRLDGKPGSRESGP